MNTRRPSTQTMHVSDVGRQLETLVLQIQQRETRVVVEQGGVPVIGLVSADDLQRLDQLDREREADFAVVDELREAFSDVSDDEIERETDRALAKVRAERKHAATRT